MAIPATCLTMLSNQKQVERDINEYMIGPEKEALYIEFKAVFKFLRDYAINVNHEEMFTVTWNGKQYQLYVGRLLTIMSFFRAFVKAQFKSEVDLTEYSTIIERLFSIQELDYVNNSFLDKQYDPIIEFLLDNGIKIDQVNFLISNIINNLATLGIHFNNKAGNNICLKHFIDLAKTDPVFNECLQYTANESQQIRKIEEDNAEVSNRGFECLKHSNTTIGNLARCGSAFNVKQMAQVLFTIGFKPDLRGKTIPKIINTSFLRGLQTPEDMLIIARAARKAEINNYVYVAKGGYLSRKFLLSKIDTFVDVDENSSCNTRHPVSIKITDKKILGRFDQRFYLDDDGKDKVIRDTNTSLIGRTLRIYSPITCANKDICWKCYGKLARINRDTHAALYAGHNVGEQTIQKQLATKHLLQTDTEEINEEEFGDFLQVTTNDIVLTGKSTFIEITDEQMQVNNHGVYFCNEFNIYRGEKFIKTVKLEQNLLLSADAEYVVQSGRRIGFNDTENNIIFSIDLKTKEINRSLNLLIDLLEKRTHAGITKIDELVQTVTETLIDAGFDTMSVHTETILRNLVVDVITKKAPDYAEQTVNYEFISIPDAIKNGPLAVSMLFEHHRNQFAQIDIFDRKAESILDALYME